MPGEKKPRRRYGCSLRMLLFAVVVLGVLSGLVGRKVRQVKDQRRAVAEFQAADMSVAYDYQIANGFQAAEPPGPTWIRRSFGNDSFAHVEVVGPRGVYFSHPFAADVDDAMLAHLRSLPRIKWLRLEYCGKVTDAGLSHVASLRRLEVLDLSGTPTNGSGLDGLRSSKSLRVLNLNDTKITSEHLGKLLATLDSLEQLSLAGTPITDAVVPQLLQLEKLEQLDILGTNISPLEADRLHRLLPNCSVMYIWESSDFLPLQPELE